MADSRVRLVTAGMAGVALGFGGALLATVAAPEPEPIEVTTRPEPTPAERETKWVDIRRADDAHKPGVAHSAVAYKVLGMDDHTCGVSVDQIRFRFDQPAEVLAVDVSVDIPTANSIVEVMVSAHGEMGYGTERTASPLIHTSWTDGGGPSSTDKFVTLPAPVHLDAGEHVTVGAWICSGVGGGVSPEVILHYRWR